MLSWNHRKVWQLSPRELRLSAAGRVLAAFGLATVVVGCGSTDASNGPSTDAAASQAQPGADASPASAADAGETLYPEAAATIDGGAMIVGPLNLFNNANACLQLSLPLNTAGMVSCRVLLSGVTAGCAQDGLSPARPSDIAVVNAYGAAHPIGVPPAPVCEMKQLPLDVNCSTESVLGWCYVHGTCLADAGLMCAQQICTATDFERMFITDNHYNSNFDGAWLVCP